MTRNEAFLTFLSGIAVSLFTSALMEVRVQAVALGQLGSLVSLLASAFLFFMASLRASRAADERMRTRGDRAGTDFDGAFRVPVFGVAASASLLIGMVLRVASEGPH